MMDISMWYVVPRQKKRGVYEQEVNLLSACMSMILNITVQRLTRKAVKL